MTELKEFVVCRALWGDNYSTFFLGGHHSTIKL